MSRRSRPSLLANAQLSGLNTIQENDSVETFSTFPSLPTSSDMSRRSSFASAGIVPLDWNAERVRRESTTDSLLSIPGIYSFDIDMTREVLPYGRSKSCPGSPVDAQAGASSPQRQSRKAAMSSVSRSESSASLGSLNSNSTASSADTGAFGRTLRAHARATTASGMYDDDESMMTSGQSPADSGRIGQKSSDAGSPFRRALKACLRKRSL
ncbi:hypothetical protein PYCC9005_003482 [Savitreella phatthalungensis]